MYMRVSNDKTFMLNDHFNKYKKMNERKKTKNYCHSPFVTNLLLAANTWDKKQYKSVI